MDINQDPNYIKNLDDSVILEIVDRYNRDMPPRASVVIVTYNNKKALLDNLEALNKQTVEDFEILIIDNNDRINISEFVLKYNVKYIRLKKNYGASTGRNVGTKFAQSAIIIFLDDDAIPAHNFVEEHILAHQNYNIFGLRGKVLNKTNSIYNIFAKHYDLGEKVINYYINFEGNASFKRDFLVQIGGFNPELWGHEGWELTFRGVIKYGDKNKFIYYPKAIIYHDYSSTFLKHVKKKIRHRKNLKILKSRFPDILLFREEYLSSIRNNSRIKI